MRRATRISVVSLAVLLLCALAITLALIAVSHGWQRERVRALLETAIRDAVAEAGLEARVHLGSVEGPLYPELGLRNLVIEQPGGSGLIARNVDLRLDLGRLLLDRQVVVEKLQVAGATLRLERDPLHGWLRVRTGEATPPGPIADDDASGELRRDVAVVLRAFELRDSRFEAVDPDPTAPTRLVGSVEAEFHDIELPRGGAIGWPRAASLMLVLEPGRVAGRALHDANLKFNLVGSRLELADARLDSEFGQAQISGSTDVAAWLDASQPGSIALEAQVESLDLSTVTGRTELAGALSGTLKLDASHRPGDALEDSEARVSLRLAPSQIGQLRIESGELEGSFLDRHWTLSRAELASTALQMRAHGSGDLERIADLDVQIAVSDLGALSALIDEDASGSFSFNARAAGPWRAPTGTVALDAQSLVVAGTELGTVHVRAEGAANGHIQMTSLTVDGPQLQIANDGPVALQLSADSIAIERARLRLPELEAVTLVGRISRDGAHDLRMTIEGLDLARVNARLATPLALEGRLDAALSSKGSLPRPVLRGAATWSGPELARLEADPIEIEFETRAGELHADVRLDARGREQLRATLRTPWVPGVDPLRALENASTVASISGSGIELALLAGLQPNAIRNVEGQLALEVELRGGSPEPSLVGEIRLTRGGFEIDGVAPRLGPLDARVSFSRNALRIENFALSVGAEGRATLHGEVVLADLQPLGVDLLLELSALPMQQGSALRGSLDGSLTVVGRFDALVATGDLSLRDLRYRLMRERDPLLDEITVRRGNDSPAVAKPSAGGHELYTNASVDVRIDLPPVGRVEGQGADLEVSGALRARKAANRPLAVTGAVEVLQGSYRLRGKAFEIERGRAVFTGRADLDPELDARALHRARDVSIFAIVYGRASAPMVRLESDPPFPEQDVLALLLFGKTREELGGAQRGALESALAQTAGGVAVESLEALAGVDIPVDSIEVETSSDSAAPVVGVGRYVTKDVFVRFGQDFGSEGDSEVRIDWRLAPRWSIESRTSSTGNSSADLIWTLDY